MPYMLVEREDGKTCVYKHDEQGRPVGEPIGCHDDVDKAKEQLSALYASEEKDAHTIVSYGGEIKALGDGRIGGYLVRYSNETDTDLENDFFTAGTDYGRLTSSPVYYHHGQDKTLGKRVLGEATLKSDDFGIWAEVQLALRDQYEKFLLRQAEKGKLGWSSGTAAHLVEREKKGTAMWIKAWPLGLDASLTLMPAEPRNSVTPLKSLSELQPLEDVHEGEPEAGQPVARESSDEAEIKSTNHKEPIMAELTLEQADLTAIQDSIKSMGTELQEIKAALPVVNSAGVQVVHDPADDPFEGIAQQCKAIKSYEISKGTNFDPRLKRLSDKGISGTGGSEGVPSEGGFLLDPTLAADIIKPIHEAGPFVDKCRKLPVSSNSNYGWINGVDETNRATGSRWGGVVGYRLAEGGSITPSKPAFRRINWELKKYGVYIYGTDELLADTTQFNAIVQQSAAEELAFMANVDVYAGLGVGGPLGVMNSGALVTVAKETNQTADTIIYENIVKLWARLHPRNKANAVWFINCECATQLDALALVAGTSAIPAYFVGTRPDGVSTLKGRPIVETEFNEALGDKGDILLADFGEYLFWEKAGVQSASSIHVAFVTDETVFRFIYRCDGTSAIASPLTPYKGAGTLSPFVTLAERA